MTPSNPDRYAIDAPLLLGNHFTARDRRARDAAVLLVQTPLPRQNNWQGQLEQLSGLRHPAILALTDYTLSDAQLCLVYPLPAAPGLVQLLASGRKTGVRQVLALALKLLDSLNYLHRQGLAHGQLDAAHLLLGSDGQPVLLDSGLTLVGQETSAWLHAQKLDLQGLARLIVQLLEGQLRLPAQLPPTLPHTPDSLFALLQPYLSAALFHSELSAGALLATLKDWFEQLPHPDGEDPRPAIERLFERMQATQDFPTLSQGVIALNLIQSSDAERLQTLSDAILKDVSLTSKLLKVVNTARFSQFGGTISTVSRAIVILGVETIRNLALTLLLFDHLSDQTQARLLRDALLRALLRGLWARTLCRAAGYPRDAETANVCGLFQNLGELLGLFYFRADAIEVVQRSSAGEAPEAAARAVFGVSYPELGMAVARHWSFPGAIVSSLGAVEARDYRQSEQPEIRLKLFVHAADELLDWMERGSGDLSSLQNILARYQGLLGMDAARLLQLLHEGCDEYLQYLDSLQLHTRQSVVLTRVHAFHHPDVATQGVDALEALTLEDERTTLPHDSAGLLANGVQDVTNAMMGVCSLNDLLRMVLETLYRALNAEHVLFCARDPRAERLQARFGFGRDIQRLIGGFDLPLAGNDSVFQLALQRNADILIEDIHAGVIAERIPNWYEALTGCQSFLILPLQLDGRTIGCIYLDRRAAGSLKLNAHELNLVKTLRNQALLAIQQKRG